MGKTVCALTVMPSTTVHPHTRGENLLTARRRTAGPGSPPHAWGKLHPSRIRSLYPRTTPTRVGKTISCHPGSAGKTVHPHTRGENQANSVSSSSTRGPSPHAWGKRREPADPRLGLRTIPTRVGKTTIQYRLGRWRADHPHTRGENGEKEETATMRHGSSPHAWGKRLAGVRMRSVHPHTRGENDCRVWRP